MKIFLFLVLSFLFSFSVFAQKTQPTPPDDDSVVKVSTELVQIDAVVTDKQGNQVTDLKAEDFELFQDGKPQKITNFSYVNQSSQKQTRTPAANKTDKNAPLPPPVSVSSPNEFGRVITFVVDDGNCHATVGGMRAAREGLEKFIREQMLPTDRVAIYQTRSGSSLLQQYTSDKTRLLSIARKINWRPAAGFCSTSGEDHIPARNNSNLKGEGAQTFESDRDRERSDAAERFYRDKATSGTIGVLRYAISGLRNIGGRKTLFLLTDSLPISNGRNSLFNSFYDMRDVAELANRTSVVINPIDVRGLNYDSATAVDDFGIRNNPNAVGKVMASRQLSNDSRQSGLVYAASETGGKFYKNMSYLDQPIGEALKLEKGYYLLGYQPEDETFTGKKFHKIEIKLKRPDLNVSSRSGFSGVTDKEIRPKPRTGDSELYEAIVSPLPNAGLNLRVTAFFGNTPTEGNFVRALLYLDGKQITFTDDAGGMKKAVFDVVAVTLNEKNNVVDEFNRTHTIKLPAANLADVQRSGLIYSVDVPVKKAGAYNFRVAVRDAASKLLGSAGQQVEVPDLKKDKIFLSGLTLGEVAVKNGKPVLPSIEKAENAFSTVEAASVPAIRRFRPSAILGYSYKIYNAQIDKAGNQPKLSTQIRLYREGELISDSGAQPAQIEAQTDITRIGDYGYLRLPPETPKGDYALQIIIKDLQTNRIVTESIDFEVVE
jgi:VWFA-related protein